MHFNRLIIFLFVNILLSQAYYESAIGIDYSSYSARSLSLASSSQISEVGAYCLLFNPSNITHNNGFSLSISNLIDTYNSVLSRKQSMEYTDNVKGITLDYDNQIKNTIDDTLVNYSIEFSKTFQDSSGYRTFTVISMDIG